MIVKCSVSAVSVYLEASRDRSFYRPNETTWTPFTAATSKGPKHVLKEFTLVVFFRQSSSDVTEPTPEDLEVAHALAAILGFRVCLCTPVKS